MGISATLPWECPKHLTLNQVSDEAAAEVHGLRRSALLVRRLCSPWASRSFRKSSVSCRPPVAGLPTNCLSLSRSVFCFPCSPMPSAEAGLACEAARSIAVDTKIDFDTALDFVVHVRQRWDCNGHFQKCPVCRLQVKRECRSHPSPHKVGACFPTSSTVTASMSLCRHGFTEAETQAAEPH